SLTSPDHTSCRAEATLDRLLNELAAAGVTLLVSTHDLHALPELADEAVLLMRQVLLHDSPAEVLRPDNLALAFGLDVTDTTTGASPTSGDAGAASGGGAA